MPPRFRGRSTPSYAWCRRSPPHPDSCPRLDRRRSHPSVPSRSSMEIPFRGSSDWLDTVTVSRGRASTTTTRRTKSGDFHRPPAGTATWPPVGTLSRPWTRLLADPGKQLPEGIVRINIAHPLNTAIHHGAVTADPGAESEQAQRRRLEWRDCPCHHTRPHLTMLLSVLPADHCPGHVPGLDLAGQQAQSGARAIVRRRLLCQGGHNDRSHEVATLRRSEPIDIRRFLPDEPRKLWVFGLGRAAHVRFKCSPVRPGSQPRVYRLGSDWRGTGVVRLAVRRAATAGAHQ